jgi:GT2 family glycosyltransferase
MVEISVIIPHFDDLVRLDRCLTALSCQTMASDRYEIVVADNMSPGGEAAVRAVIAGRARLVSAAERGAGPARNAAVSAAGGDVLAFTDADCLPEPGWLEAGLAGLAHHDIVGGCVRILVEGDSAKSGPEAFEAVFAFHNRRYIEREGFSVTANLFCRRRVYDAVGPFLVGMSEDRDWCLRARALGYRLGYQPSAVVGHPARADWPSLLVKWRRLNAELFANAQMRRGGRLRWLAASAAMPVSILVHLPLLLASPALGDMRERARGAATLVRLRLWRCADGLLRLMGSHA